MTQWLGALAGLGGSRFESRAPTCWLTIAVTPVSGDPVPSSGLLGHCMHIVHKYTCRQNHSDTHNANKSLLKKINLKKISLYQTVP